MNDVEDLQAIWFWNIFVIFRAESLLQLVSDDLILACNKKFPIRKRDRICTNLSFLNKNCIKHLLENG